MIQLAAPHYAAWALLALPIIALFILRVRLRRQPVSTLLFWDQLMQDRRPRAWWQRLRNVVSLLLQLALLALVVAALVDPLWWWQAAQPRRVMLVVDNSASMNARLAADADSRLQQAQQAAISIVRSLRDRDRMAIITAGGAPRVQLGMTDDRRRLQQAVQTLPATDAPDQLSMAVELARQLVAGEADGEIVVLTDGASATKALAADDQVSVYGVGQPADNVAITAFQVRRSVADALSYQVLVEVTNFSRDPVERRLEIDLEEAAVDVVPLSLQPGQSWRQTLDHASDAGGRLTARLAGDDALATDDTALAVLPRRDPVPVVLVTPGSLFLQNVLAAIPGVTLSVVDSVPADLPPEAILVLHRNVPSKLPAGAVLVIDPQSSSDLWQLADALQSPLVSGQAEDSPLLAHLRLQNVLLPGARQIRFQAASESLLTTPLDEPLYARLPRRDGDVLVLLTELDQGDLPLRIAFPVMMKNAVEWFLGSKGELQPALATGQSTVLRVPGIGDATVAEATSETPDTATGISAAAEEQAVAAVANPPRRPAASWMLRSPSGRTAPLSSRGGSVSVGPLQQTGLWLAGPRGLVGEGSALHPLDQRVVPLAVNLTSASESDLRADHDLRLPPSAALSGLGGHSLWVYLVALAVLGLVGEWVLYQRRVVA